MSNRNEIGCLIYLGIGGLFILLYYLIVYPILWIYILFGLSGIFLLLLILNFLQVIYFINFETNFKSIVKFDQNASRTYYDNLLKTNRTEKVDYDVSYYRFISSTKIFDCE